MSTGQAGDNKEGLKESNNSFENEIEGGKNKHLVKCVFCPCIMLNPGMGSYFKTDFDLPKMTRKKKTEEDDGVEFEKVNDFWEVRNMYTFENIGFSKTVGNTKYLVCADCEMGPLGYFNLETNFSYLALARVKHVH